MNSRAIDHPPICDKYNELILTVKHISIECTALTMLRSRIFGGDNVTLASVLCSNAYAKNVCVYFRESKLFEKI